jgi:hypothetical protein
MSTHLKLSTSLIPSARQMIEPIARSLQERVALGGKVQGNIALRIQS